MNIFKANTEALVATGIYHKEKKKVYYKYFKINYEHYLQVTSITSSYFVGQNKKKGRTATLLRNETTKRAAATGHSYSWGEMS